MGYGYEEGHTIFVLLYQSAPSNLLGLQASQVWSASPNKSLQCTYFCSTLRKLAHNLVARENHTILSAPYSNAPPTLLGLMEPPPFLPYPLYPLILIGDAEDVDDMV
jgi:hypothetical protein